MSADELKNTVVQAAELLEYFKRQTTAASEANDAAASRLRNATEAAPAIFRQAANHAFDGFERRFQELDQRINSTAQNFIGLLGHFEKRIMLVVSIIVVGVVALLFSAVAGVWYFKGEIERNQIEVHMLHAYNQADVSLCDGQLCVRIDKKGKHYGDYVLVAPR